MALQRKASEQATQYLDCMWSQPLPLHFHAHTSTSVQSPAFSLLLSSAGEWSRSRQESAARCQQAEPYTWWTGRTRGEGGGPQLREVCAQGFFVNLRKAGETGCKPSSSHSGICCVILSFKARMKAGQLELPLEVC